MGYLDSLKAPSVVALAACLDSHDNDLAAEATAALIRCGEAGHVAVLRATARSAQEGKNTALVRRHLHHKPPSSL